MTSDHLQGQRRCGAAPAAAAEDARGGQEAPAAAATAKGKKTAQCGSSGFGPDIPPLRLISGSYPIVENIFIYYTG